MTIQPTNDNRPQPQAGTSRTDRKGDKIAKSPAKKPDGQNPQRRDGKH